MRSYIFTITAVLFACCAAAAAQTLKYRDDAVHADAAAAQAAYAIQRLVRRLDGAQDLARTGEQLLPGLGDEQLQEQHQDDDEDDGRWVGRWIRFARALHPDRSPPPLADSRELG